MKIALLCNGYGLVNRGSERFSSDFKAHMDKYNTVDIIGVKDTETKTRNDYRIPWRNGKAYLESYNFGKKLYQNHTLDDYDVILNNSGFPCSKWCAKQRKRSGTPFITRARGGGYEEHLSAHYKPDVMIFSTCYHRNMILRFRNQHSQIIPNAIDPLTKDKVPLPEKYKHLERPLFLSTSALVGFKRIPLMIDALKHYGKGTIIQTSDGSSRDNILEHAKKTIGDKFYYIGKIPDDELYALYDNCDAYLHAANDDCFPNTYLEAMAHGLPLIVQSTSRSKEILGNTAIYVDCKNAKEFASAMDVIKIDNWEWEERIKRQLSFYTWERVIDLYNRIIDEVTQ